MKKFFKIFGGIIILIIFSILIYSTIVIIKAKTETTEIIQNVLKSDKMILSVKDLSKWQIDALLVVEDPDFFNHKGIDFNTPGAGLTTISQGLVKLLYFHQFKPGLAKFKQTLISRFVFDPMVSKNDQLKLFINLVYMGNINGTSIYGFSKASEIYFHKPFSQLNRDEYLSLIALIIAPNTFNPIQHKIENTERVQRIKLLISGEYKPKSLMDIYYGPLNDNLINELPKASYYPDIYQ